jgi:hypothetical protein
VARLFTARGGLPPALLAVAELTSAEIAVRSLRTAVARAALGRPFDAAERARVPALVARGQSAHGAACAR